LFVIALVVFVSSLVRYFHNHVHFIRSHILPAFSNARLAVFPREIAVPVAHLVPAEPYH
jgi:hemolysin-activating ACP:hemolysin acyltransferase